MKEETGDREKWVDDVKVIALFHPTSPYWYLYALPLFL